MTGQFLKNSAEPGWVGKTEGDGDFSHALGAGAEKVLGLRDSAAVMIVLIGQAHHLLEYSREVGRGHSGFPGNVVEVYIGSVVVVDKTNGLLDLMVLAGGNGGRRPSRRGRRTGLGKDVLSALLIRLTKGEIEVDLCGQLGYAEGFLQIIAGAAPKCLDRHLLVAVCRDNDNENGWRDVLDLFHDIDAGYVGQPVFDDREIDVATPLHPLDRNPAGLDRDDSVGVGKALDVPSIVVNDQYLGRYGISHGGWTRVVCTFPAVFRALVSRWLGSHCDNSPNPSAQTPARNGLGDMFGGTRATR
jgi:hypothetical protein